MVVRLLEVLTSSDLRVIPFTINGKEREMAFLPSRLLTCESVNKADKILIKNYLSKGSLQDEGKIIRILSHLFSTSPSTFMKTVGFEFKGLFGQTVHLTFFKNYRKFVHAINLANAIFQGILTFSGKVPYHKSASYKRGVLLNRSLSNAYPLLTLLQHYLRVFPKCIEEKDLIKRIKLSLTGKFALVGSQELPPRYREDSFSILPSSMEFYLTYKRSRKERLNLFFSLQQCKGLCESVPTSFLKEGLEKHRKGLVRKEQDLIQKDPVMYESLRKYASEKFGKIVAENYSPYTTKLPNSSACLEASRVHGGTKAFLIEKQQLLVSNSSYNYDAHHRVEPYVIGLFGPPGIGKTKAIKNLISFFQKEFFSQFKERSDLVYTRSCASSFWDHYHQQPIVVLDDLGQDLSTQSDIIEFEQLISSNPYYVPMASLEQKGLMFNSPIVIVTSNLRFGSTLLNRGGTSSILDIFSFWRRFSCPISLCNLRDHQNNNISGSCLLTLMELITPDVHWNKYHDQIEDNGVSQSGKLDYFLSIQNIPLKYLEIQNTKDITTFYSHLKREYVNRLNYHDQELLKTWTQSIHSMEVNLEKDTNDVSFTCSMKDVDRFSEGLHMEVQFPISPPMDLPKIQAIPLPEPLKVRVITKGQADLRCLKPLQMAMWKSLSYYPEFCLTHGCKKFEGKLNPEKFDEDLLDSMEKEIQRINLLPGYWVSGDYDAATDNLPMWVTEALMEGILEHITHEPTKNWARYEIGPHLITYPKSYEIEEGIQNSGQLMGSLLSFPLLCMANDFLCSQLAGFEPGSYLINGDDIVGKETMENIQKWKEHSDSVGLSLSVGKNFIDKEFCTVNSQLFNKGERLSTGKVGLLYRKDLTLGECWSNFQRYYGYDEIFFNFFIRNNFKQLNNTPCSLWVPDTHGGLGHVLVHSKVVNQQLAKKVYFTKLFKRLHSKQDSVLKKTLGKKVQQLNVPMFKPLLSKESLDSLKKEESFFEKLSSFDIIENPFKKDSEFGHKQVHKFERDTLPQFPTIKQIIHDANIKVHDLPSLNDFVVVQKIIPDTKDFNGLQKKKYSSFWKSFTDFIQLERSSVIEKLTITDKIIFDLNTEEELFVQNVFGDIQDWINEEDDTTDMIIHIKHEQTEVNRLDDPLKSIDFNLVNHSIQNSIIKSSLNRNDFHFSKLYEANLKLRVLEEEPKFEDLDWGDVPN